MQRKMYLKKKEKIIRVLNISAGGRPLRSGGHWLQDRDLNFFPQCFGIVMQRRKLNIFRMVFNS